MQDRYAADVGDYLTFGFMWQLARPAREGGAAMPLGLNWYLGPNEDHNADGKHDAYLWRDTPLYRDLASRDPELFEVMRRVHATGRSVANLERRGALPPGTPTHAERLELGQSADARAAWHARALSVLEAPPLVFADPDNGYRTGFSGARMFKYALAQELADYARRGQAVALYCHAARRGTVDQQARERLADLAARLDQRPVAAVVAHRGSSRYFLVTAPARHERRLARAADGFVERFAGHARRAA